MFTLPSQIDAASFAGAYPHHKARFAAGLIELAVYCGHAVKGGYALSESTAT